MRYIDKFGRKIDHERNFFEIDHERNFFDNWIDKLKFTLFIIMDQNYYLAFVIAENNIGEKKN